MFQAEWVVKKPSALTSLEAMSIGTAGLTAAASVLKIFDSSQESDLPVLVSGGHWWRGLYWCDANV
jgi:NADPH:quinone reductase-like Zn-dependent oxidoreductase